MKKLLTTLAIALAMSGAMAQKKIYIPHDLRQYDLTCDSARWCWRNSSQTDNLVFLWEKGFGRDVAKAPQLDGHPMTVNLPNLERRVESFYSFFRDTLKFTRPGSKADTYKMLVMLNYSLEGTAYGGTYDDFIGALWVAPNRIQDRKLNCLAHELGHSFQAQIQADSLGDAWGGSGFFEMTSQWMLWQVNPDWLTDENYHFEAFKKLTHKAFLHFENIYHSPYVIEWWAERRGRTTIADLFRQGRIGEDPAMTYMRLWGLTQEQFCAELFAGYQHLLNFDFTHARRETRRYACTFSTPTEPAADGWQQPKGCAPEQYGFNAIKLTPAQKVKVKFQGGEHRYGFVGVTTDGQSVYSPMYSKPSATVAFKAPKGKQWQHLYFLVMGAPKQHTPLIERAEKPAQYAYRYMVE